MIRLEPIGIPSGGVTLTGLHYRPKTTHRTTALAMAHGFTSGKYSLDGLAGYLAGKGYPCVTFDCVGHKLGGSGGEMQTIQQAAENLRDATQWIRRNRAPERILLLGHSMGAAAALQVAAQENRTPGTPPVAGVVCLCTGTHPSAAFDSVIGKTMLAQREDYVTGAPRRQLLNELDAMVLSAQEIGSIPALFVAAKHDALIPAARTEELAALAPNAAVATIDAVHLDAPDRSKTVVLQWLEAQGF